MGSDMADLALLQQIADLIESSEGDASDTEQLAGASGRATFGPPWFGMRDALAELEQEGLIEIDPGIAEHHDPDRPTPATDRLYLVVTEAGRSALEPRNSA
jgi:hypothetical protein